MEAIKIVPSWAELMPLLWEVAANGNQDAQAELMRLARIVDDLNAERQAELPEVKS